MNWAKSLSFFSRARASLHIVAAGIFAILMVVHLDAIAKNILLLHFYNTLFPFLTNRTLFWVAVTLDFIGILICVKYCAQNMADYFIHGFIVLMLWYRFGLHLTNPGGYTCGCLGILTVIFNLTTSQEQAAAYGVLAMLFFCGAPGLASGLSKSMKLYFPKAALLIVVTFLASSGKAATIELAGHYAYTNYNPRTGIPIVTDAGVHEDGRYQFVTVLRDQIWRISVTNSEDPGLWTELVYDGTDTYVFTPCTSPFLSENNEPTNSTYVTVSPSVYLLPALSDWAYSYIPWVTFGLNPAKAKPDSSGLREIPLPWQTPRLKERAYGWNWVLQTSGEGRFISTCRIEREYRLDLATQPGELLRTEIDYPESVADKNIYLDSLNYRKQIPNHFIDTEYTCTAWLTTNGMTIPIKSEMQQFQRLVRKTPKSPLTRASLEVDTVQIDPKDVAILGKADLTRVVKDYRYKKSNEDRIYKRAEYVLTPGEAWKSDADTVLLRQQSDFLKHGRKYNWYDYNAKQILVWALGVALVLPPAILLLRKNKTTKG